MNKIIIVTGGTRGLGLAITKKCLQEKYKVVAVGRNINEGFKELKEKYSNLLSFEMFDFININEIHNFAFFLQEKYGRPWGLVNNAAIGKDGVLVTMHDKDIYDVLSINVIAPIVFTKYMIRPMLLSREGRIVNISSIISNTGYSGLSVYAASKSALSGFTKSLSRELGKANITVNTVAPGYLDTDMSKGINEKQIISIKKRSSLNRLADVDDVAEAVCYLISEKAKNITGITMTVDAGSTA